MKELLDWLYRNGDIVFLIIVGFQILQIVVFIELIRAIFAISRNSTIMTENIQKMHNQLTEIYKLIDNADELLAIEIREQRAMHGYPTNRRLDDARPDE